MLGRYTTGPGCLVGSRILPYPVLSKPRDPLRWPWRKLHTGQLALLHALLTAGWVAARILTRDRPWWLHFINEFTPLLLAAGAPLGTAAMLTGSARGALASLLPLSLFFG